MEEEPGFTQNFYKCFSTREKKILAELFGPGYPTQDLPSKSVNRIVYKFRTSVFGKMKVSHLMQYLLRYYVLVESEKIELADDTTTEEQKALVLLDSLSYKGSYAIGALYISLLDSSNETFGPPTHYQLACELKRIIQAECASASLTLSDASQDTEDSKQALEAVMTGLVKIEITEHQGRALCDELGIEFQVADTKAIELDSICKRWLGKRGTWAQLSDLVEALLLTKGLGRYSTNLRAPVYQNLKVFLEGMHEEWTCIGKFIGYADSVLESIVDAHDTVSTQLDEFLRTWKVPDCGQRTSVILQKLKSAAGVRHAQSRTVRGKQAIPTLNLQSTAKQSSLADNVQSDTETTYVSSLKLNIIRSSELTPTATTSTSLGDQNPRDRDSNEGSECNSFNTSEEKTTHMESVKSSNPSSDSENQLVPAYDSQEGTTTEIKEESRNSPTNPHNVLPSEGCDQHVLTTEPLTSETVSQEISDGTELSQQIPPQHTHISEDLQTGIVVMKQSTQLVETNHSDENLEVLPITTSQVNELNRVTSGTLAEHTRVKSEEKFQDSFSDTETSKKPLPNQSAGANTLQNDPVHSQGNTAKVDMPNGQKSTQKVGDYPIHDVVEMNSTDRLGEVLSLGYDVNKKRKTDGRTALHVACFNGYVRAVKLLVASCTDVNSKDKAGNHCLHFVKTLESPSIVSCLLENGASSDPPNRQFCTPLIIACQIGDHVLETLECLLKYGASCDGLPKCSSNPLLQACEKGYAKLVICLLSAKAGIDRKDLQTGETPLIKACLNTHVDIIKKFLLHRPDLEATDKENRTPLSVAVVKGSLEIVRLLTEAGADIHSTRPCPDDTTGQVFNITPLCDALARGYFFIAKYLIEKGANINTTDKMNQAPDKTKGFISPLSFACMTNQVQMVKYLVTLEQFEVTLPFIADPIVEALKRGHNECAMILSEKYGGMQKLKQDANIQKRLDLARQLSIQKHLSGATQTSSKASVDTTSDQQLAYAHKQVDSLQLDDVHPGTAHTNHSQDDSEESDSSNELTISTPAKDDEPTPPNVTEQFKIETLNALDVEEEASPISTSNDNLVNQLSPPSSPVLQANISPPLRVPDVPKQLDLTGGLNEYTSDEGTNPFKSLPKSPVLSGTEAEMQVQPMQLGDADSLRSFQGSAVEVLYDFMQYLISACLQTKTAEDIIGKAETFGDTKLVNFFTRYFFDIANIPSHELVSEFLQGFPSPMSFVFAARLCSKNDLYTVLKNVGREDFPDQLMLALHQFPNADNLPWSGTGVLDAFFNQSFYASQSPSPDLESRRPPQTYSAAPTETYPFPEGGHRLGYGDKPPGSLPSVGKKAQKAPQETAITTSSLLNDLDTCNESSDAAPDVRTLTDTGTQRQETHGGAANVKHEDTHRTVLTDTGTQHQGSHGGAANVKHEDTHRTVLTDKETQHQETHGGAANVKHEDTHRTVLTDTGTQNEDSDIAPEAVHEKLVTDGETQNQDTHDGASNVTPEAVHMEVSTAVGKEHQPKEGREERSVVDVVTTVSTESDSCDQTVPIHVKRKPTILHSKSTEKTKRQPFSVEYSSDSEDGSVSAIRKNDVDSASESDSDKKSIPPSTSVGISEKQTKFSEHKRVIKAPSTAPANGHKSSMQPHTSATKPKLPSAIPKPHTPQLKHKKNASKSFGEQVTTQTRTSYHRSHKASPQIPPTQQKQHSPVQPSKIPKPKPNTTRRSNLQTKTEALTPPQDRKTAGTHTRSEISMKSSPAPVLPTSAHKSMPLASLHGMSSAYNQPPLKPTSSFEPLKKEDNPILLEDRVRGGFSLAFVSDQILNPEELFRKLSANISNWKMLGRYLLISDEDIEKIASSHFLNEQGKVCNLLMAWRNSSLLTGKDVTYKPLSKALQYCMHDHLLSVLEHHHSRKSSHSSSRDLTISVQLTDFWDTLRPFIEDKISNGYKNVSVTLKFE